MRGQSALAYKFAIILSIVYTKKALKWLGKQKSPLGGFFVPSIYSIAHFKIHLFIAIFLSYPQVIHSISPKLYT